MLAVWARYQVRAVGSATKDIHSSTVGEDGSPPSPPLRATASQPSQSSRSFTPRHHGLPGGVASIGASTPRLSCHRMNDMAARRNGRCCGAPAERTVVRPGDQFEPSGRVVAYRLDLIQGPRRSGAAPEVHLLIVGHLLRLVRIGEAELAW